MHAMRYINYSLTGLIKDEYFRKWVLHPDETSDHYWNEWLARHPEKKPLVEEARQMIRLIRFKNERLGSDDVGRLWVRITRAANRGTGRPVPLRQAGLSVLWRRSLRWTAVLLLLICPAVLVLYLKDPGRSLEYMAGRHETKNLVLPDASKAILDAGSSLKYRAGSPGKDEPRQVWLEGRAFFEVTSRPVEGGPGFVVHTSELDVHVLGTEFMVSSNPSERRVVLQSGKVRLLVKHSRAEFDMEPGEMVEISPEKDVVQKKAVELEPYLLWKEQEWTLDNTPLNEIIARIEDKYQVRVLLADSSLAQLRLSGSLPADNLDKLLLVLRESAKVEIEKREWNTFMISKQE